MSRTVEAAAQQYRLDSDDDSEVAYSEGSDGEGRPSAAWRRALSAAAIAFVGATACMVCLAVYHTADGSSKRSLARSSGTVQLEELDTHSPFHQEATSSLLKPVERMHDGNVCESNEELFEGLCYHKCSLLTRGQEPIRTSAWSCCKAHPCGLTNEAADLGKKVLCSGYDVSGSGGCPHRPGACLTDEELHLGNCYKKCENLTNGEFPFRAAAETCCKTAGMGCLDIFNTKTRAAFAVGGGAGDHDPSTPSEVHAPEESLTEADLTAAEAEPADVGPVTIAPNARPEPLVKLGGHNCSSDEELYGGLCYRKCSLLTYGTHPIRTSSWTCCESHPCGFKNQKGSIGHSFELLCNGYDVGGNGGCPEAPAVTACAADEEEVLGVCYRKCALLTHGKFPYRMAAATCCKTRGVGCFDLFNDRTSDAYDVGSGVAKKASSPAKSQFRQDGHASGFMMRK